MGGIKINELPSSNGIEPNLTYSYEYLKDRFKGALNHGVLLQEINIHLFLAMAQKIDSLEEQIKELKTISTPS